MKLIFHGISKPGYSLLKIESVWPDLTVMLFENFYYICIFEKLNNSNLKIGRHTILNYNVNIFKAIDSAKRS